MGKEWIRVLSRPDSWRSRWSERGSEPTKGLEPLTARLQVGCATNCATPAMGTRVLTGRTRVDPGAAIDCCAASGYERLNIRIL